MIKTKTNTIQILLTLFVMLLHSSICSWAGQDAGAQIRRYQEETRQRLTTKPASTSLPNELSVTEAAAKASTESIYIAAFSVHGNTKLNEQDVYEVLKPFTGKSLDTAGIHAAADALNKLYRQKGYFAAKVFIPPQQVTNSIRLDVYEGLLDTNGIEVENKGTRIKSSVVKNILEAHIPQGEPMQRKDFERALLITEDLPGITTTSTIYPAESIGSARLRTTVTDQPMFSGNIDFDNFGNRYTGQERLGATLYLNSPSQVGDQAVVRIVTSGQRSNYAYLTYLRPVTNLGTRIGASIDYFNYDTAFINNLGRAKGQATDTRLFLTHPIYRSRHGNLNVRADISRLKIDDENDLQINGDRVVNSMTMGLHGDDDHPWLSTSGLSVFDASLTLGEVDIRGNDSYIRADRSTTRTDGTFARMNLGFSRLSRLTNHWSFFTNVRGQLANTNLDTSQKFYLGGATSISGYPIGEASGDQGAETHFEFRRDFHFLTSNIITAGLFYQIGYVKTHKNTWNDWQGSNSNLKNEFSLESTGLSLTMTLPDLWVVRGLIGWQIGNNPMQSSVSGQDSDGRDHDYRSWLQIIRYF